MNKVYSIIVAIIVVVAIGAGVYFISSNQKLSVISVSTDITAADGTLATVEGVYGTLTINGEIISSDTDVAYIHLTWEADTEFPTDYAIGSITVGDFHEYPIGLNPLWH